MPNGFRIVAYCAPKDTIALSCQRWSIQIFKNDFLNLGPWTAERETLLFFPSKDTLTHTHTLTSMTHK